MTPPVQASEIPLDAGDPMTDEEYAAFMARIGPDGTGTTVSAFNSSV